MDLARLFLYPNWVSPHIILSVLKELAGETVVVLVLFILPYCGLMLNSDIGSNSRIVPQ
jgi:hypothetical protein